ncbi:hypothetical protein BCR44DRAFT_1296418 [Catenaria anguillulae PL171]|uniref:Uncharacterized protein n=1 Tax=Catenaria anguillulae PL171 TaxID=765915 RepID=A0A1Y2HY33_9FUNG|nr:hypothetical protein BCR44DRAFT_1296418 [Catenaria anguillulae PL171]
MGTDLPFQQARQDKSPPQDRHYPRLCAMTRSSHHHPLVALRIVLALATEGSPVTQVYWTIMSLILTESSSMLPGQPAQRGADPRPSAATAATAQRPAGVTRHSTCMSRSRTCRQRAGPRCDWFVIWMGSRSSRLSSVTLGRVVELNAVAVSGMLSGVTVEEQVGSRDGGS